MRGGGLHVCAGCRQGLSTDGLPLVFQLVCNRLDEELLCQLGHAYEGAVGRQRAPMLPPRVQGGATKL